jgi:hypothetical protein
LVNPDLLHGVIDVLEDSGRFAAAWYSWGRGPERRTGETGETGSSWPPPGTCTAPRSRQQLASDRDLPR